VKPSPLTTPKIIPTLRYRDARAAIDWLCDAFDFEAELVVPGDGDSIAHAQLTFAGGMVMLGSAVDGPYGDYVKPPIDADAVCTQSAYIIIKDVDTHYTRVVAAGARIIVALEDQDHGGRAYTCRDPEGHIWNFGSYDPWASD
jgi:uncharacterized glyoxalase superfamily protein PhnB